MESGTNLYIRKDVLVFIWQLACISTWSSHPGEKWGYKFLNLLWHFSEYHHSFQFQLIFMTSSIEKNTFFRIMIKHTSFWRPTYSFLWVSLVFIENIFINKILLVFLLLTRLLLWVFHIRTSDLILTHQLVSVLIKKK